MSSEQYETLLAPSAAAGTWEHAAWQLGVHVAGPAAEDVDRQARYPHEAIEAMKAAGFMSALLPSEIGGGGASLLEMMGAVRALAVHCASSALVLAMHTIEVFSLERHGKNSALQELAREVVTDQLLLANAYSEVGLGGDVSQSICGVDTATAPWTLEKEALAISYGEYADVLLTPARRSLDASVTDQVLVAIRRPDFDLVATSEWDTLGLRGTCSRSFHIHARVDPEMVFPVPFATVVNDGAGQVRQLLLSPVWVGLGEAATSRAHACVRAAARRSVGVNPPSAIRLAEMVAELEMGRSLLLSSALRFADRSAARDLANVGLVVALRDLKVSTSKLGVWSAMTALGICGIAGYARASEYSLDRIIRDAHGGLIMVNNDRYLTDNAQLLLARKQI